MVPVDAATAVAIPVNEEALDFADMNTAPAGGSSIKFLKAPRGMKAGSNAGKVLLGDNVIMAAGETKGLIVLGLARQGYMTYKYYRTDAGDMLPFHYATAEEAIERFPKDVPGGEATFDWTDVPGGKNIGPTIIPTADLKVLVESPDGYVRLADRFWEPAYLSCTKVEFKIAEAVKDKMQRARVRDPQFQPFQMEWTLTLSADKNSNHWMGAHVVKTHALDSDWAKTIIDIMS